MTVKLDIEAVKVLSEPEEVRRQLRTAVMRAQLLRLAMKGVNATEASRVVGCAAETARRHYSDPEFRRDVLGKVDRAFAGIDAAYVKKRASLHEMIEEQAYESFNDLVVMLGRSDLQDGIRVKIHQDFLNRCEQTKPLAGGSVRIDPEQVLDAVRVAREMDAVREGKVVRMAS